MEQNTDARQSNESFIGLEDLPNELLVYVFSFLPTSRDIVRLRVRLRYVSRKIRSISETPSLWNLIYFGDLGTISVRKGVYTMY